MDHDDRVLAVKIAEMDKWADMPEYLEVITAHLAAERAEKDATIARLTAERDKYLAKKHAICQDKRSAVDELLAVQNRLTAERDALRDANENYRKAIFLLEQDKRDKYEAESVVYELSAKMEDQTMFQPVMIEIAAERERQKACAHGGDTDAFDRENSQNDWVAYISAYSGRAAEKVHRNEREGQTFRDNMIKVAALAIAAIEAHDNGYC